MGKKKKIFERLFNKKEKKNSSCCDIQLEEIKDEEQPEKQSKKTEEGKSDSCCG